MNKTSVIFILLCLLGFGAVAQNIETSRDVFLQKNYTPSTSNSAVVLDVDSALALLPVQNIKDNVALRVSMVGDTLYLGPTFHILVAGISDLNYTVQQRLDAGVTPTQLYNHGIPLSDLYGKFYEGGLIAHLTASNSSVSGFVMSQNDLEYNGLKFFQWGCYSSGTTNGALSESVGSGYANTVAIKNNCLQPDIAALAAFSLVLNTHSDWYLPTKDELNLIYQNLFQSGLNTSPTVYLSSTEINQTAVWGQNFANGAPTEEVKNDEFLIRVVRNF